MEAAYGIMSRTSDKENAKRFFAVNRGHWCIEINALIFLTKPLMKIAAAYEQAMAWKTLLDCAGKENQS